MKETNKTTTAQERPKYTPAAGAGGLVRRFMKGAKVYGVEWWVLWIGALIVALVGFMTLFPGLFTPYSPMDQNAGPQLMPPGQGHPMGTDNLNRDVWSRIVYGARTILGVALLSSLLSALVGITLGLIAGFRGKALDRVLSLIMDSVYSFPGLILAIAFAAMLGPGIMNITLAVSVVYIPTYFRQVRAQTLSIRRELYVEAARAMGAPGWVTLWRYIFPNVIATVVVIFTLNVTDAIMTEASLSYLGLGLPAGQPDWGLDLSQGKKFLPSGVWWMITYPGLMIMFLALGFTMLGEGLAEILNPRLRDR